MTVGVRSNLDQIKATERRGSGQAIPDGSTSGPASPAISAGAGIQLTSGATTQISVGWLDTDSSHRLRIASGENLSADRTLTVILGNTARTLTISGAATVSQDYSTTGTPQFARLGLGVAADATIPLDVSGATITTLRVTNTTASSASQGAGLALRSIDGAAMASGDRLGFVNFVGSTGTATAAGGASIEAFAAEAWTTGANGSNLLFLLAPIGSATRVERARLTSAGRFSADVLAVNDSNDSHLLSIACTSDLTANRTLSLAVQDGDATITLLGNPTLADWFNQGVKTTDSPDFESVSITTTLAVGSVASVQALRVTNATSFIGWQSGTLLGTGGVDGNLVLYDSGTTDFGLLQLGGTSSSFPALKRSGTTLQVRLADDSAYAPLEIASPLGISGFVAAINNISFGQIRLQSGGTDMATFDPGGITLAARLACTNTITFAGFDIGGAFFLTTLSGAITSGKLMAGFFSEVSESGLTNSGATWAAVFRNLCSTGVNGCAFFEGGDTSFESGNVGINLGGTRYAPVAPSEALEVGGNIKAQGTVETDDIGSTAAEPWKLGTQQTSTLVTLDTANWVEVEINGTIQRLALVTITTP